MPEPKASTVQSVARYPVPAINHESLIRRALPIYYALLMAILTVGALLLLVRLSQVLLLIFVSILFASAISRPAARLEKLGIPRAIAALMIYSVGLLVIGLAAWYVVPTLLRQTARMAENAPVYADRYSELRDRYERLRVDYPELRSFDQQFGDIPGRVISTVGDRIFDLPGQLFGLFLDGLAVFVISMLIITSREKILAFTLSMVHPDHREDTRDVLVKMWERVGYYLRSKLIVMLIVASMTYVSLILIGVPYPLLLSILVGLGELVPRIGAWVARIPLLAIAALGGWVTFALTFVSSVVIQNLEGSLVSPFIQGEQLDIHPLLVIIAVLVGAALLGPAGAFVSVPAAAIIQVFVEEVVVPWRKRQLETAEVESAS